MRIDRETEQATRTMLGFAVRGELDELADYVRTAGKTGVPGSVPLCVLASAYIAVDVSERWPTEADLHEIARCAAAAATGLDVTEQQIFEYLSCVALGCRRPDDVSPVEGVATVALFATANLLLTFRPKDKHWWEYLDQIWDATEAAERVSLSVLPALMLRAHYALS